MSVRVYVRSYVCTPVCAYTNSCVCKGLGARVGVVCLCKLIKHSYIYIDRATRARGTLFLYMCMMTLSIQDGRYPSTVPDVTEGLRVYKLCGTRVVVLLTRQRIAECVSLQDTN